MERLKKEFKHLFELINEPEMKILPGNLAFFMALSIVPIVTLIVYLANIFKVPLNSVIETMQGVIPKEVSNIFISIINNSGFSTTFGISMIVIFFLASNGTHSIILASNTMYGIKHSNYINRRIKAIILIIILILLVMFNLIVLGFGNHIVDWILKINALPTVRLVLYQLFVLIKWPIALLFIFFLVKLIYTIAPDSKIPSSCTTKGAIFTTILWSIATACYSYYITNITNYNLLYGSLANIIILMIWLYLLSYILVLGIAVNVSSYNLDIKDKKLNKQ